MHIFEFAFYTVGTLYALLHEPILILYFLIIVGGYMAIGSLLPGQIRLSTRKKVMMATWTQPTEGVIHNKLRVSISKAEAFLETLPKEDRPSLVSFVVKACAEVINLNPGVNLRFAFGRIFQRETIDVSCLVDIGGKDLTFVTVRNAEKMSVKQIHEFVKSEAKSMKRSDGGDQHKKISRGPSLLPTFIVTIFLKLSLFIHNTLGIGIPALSLKKNMFGAMCVTSVGNFGFEDAVAPLSEFTGCISIITVNKPLEEPVVRNGEIKIERVVYLNIAVDHRYMDGSNAKGFNEKMRSVFEEAESFYNNAQPKFD